MAYRARLMLVLLGFGAGAVEMPTLERLAEVASGWRGEVVAQVEQSYAGWDVEIGDADNDGQNEILVTGCPDSRLYLFKKTSSGWQSQLLAANLAQHQPGMGLAVKVVDLNRDGKNEIVLGTGQEGGGNALFYIMQTDGNKLTKQLVSRPHFNKSGYTHNLALHDLDGDGLLEVLSAYCGNGEIIRYDVDPALSAITARLLHKLSGSGEESLIADVDNDGQVEYLTSNGFRAGKARVEIFEFDPVGNLLVPPRLTIEGFDGNACFYASLIVGDVDNDGANEMVVGWKREQEANRATLLAYRVAGAATPVYTFAYETEDLDMAYFEKMMVVADADNDGKNEVIVSTRGDNQSERISSQHLGHVFLYEATPPNHVAQTLLANFHEDYAESSWGDVGDADNDGKNEVVLATGKGDRTQPGISYVVLLETE